MCGPIKGHVKRKAFSFSSDVGNVSSSRRFVGTIQCVPMMQPMPPWTKRLHQLADVKLIYCRSSVESNTAAQKYMTPFSFEDGVTTKATAGCEMIGGEDQLGTERKGCSRGKITGKKGCCPNKNIWYYLFKSEVQGHGQLAGDYWFLRIRDINV
ncbi:hypothetical protein MKX01_019119 [Papaver californicum]|nr:hypothetical protein MKX01_019119 [Papaver californicum]